MGIFQKQTCQGHEDIIMNYWHTAYNISVANKSQGWYKVYTHIHNVFVKCKINSKCLTSDVAIRVLTCSIYQTVLTVSVLLVMIGSSGQHTGLSLLHGLEGFSSQVLVPTGMKMLLKMLVPVGTC